MFEAYARGVTDGAKVRCRRPAHKFVLLRKGPTPYRATDVLGVLQLMSFISVTNGDSELERLKILTEDGPEALAALDPSYPEWLPVTSPPGALAESSVDRLTEDLAVFTATAGMGGGSNNWAIAPPRTSTGRAILANDLHLPPILPPYWYLAHIRTPDWAVAGASFVGGPTFPVGHNDSAAWGVTFGFVDNTDLFIEEMGDALAAVIKTLREQYGTDANQWAWGRVRPLTLRHSVGERAPFHRVFNLGPFAWGGDTNTVGQASADVADPAANPSFIASLRMVVDVGNWDESRFILPGGQSGNPLSPHYDDQLALWQRGEGVTIAWSPIWVKRRAQFDLRLVPR